MSSTPESSWPHCAMPLRAAKRICVAAIVFAVERAERMKRNTTVPLSLRQFCCRWFTRRREDEEKEGLLTRDAQLLEDAAPPVQTNQPRVASGGLRERASVNNNNEDAYGDWERRDHVRRVARVGFQSRVQVSVFFQSS